MDRLVFSFSIVLFSCIPTLAKDKEDFLIQGIIWANHVREITAPIVDVVSYQASIFGDLTKTPEDLDLAPVIKEVKKQIKAHNASVGKLNSNQKRDELLRLQHNLKVVKELQKSVVEMRNSLKRIVGLPVPRITSAPNIIESWYIRELPALYKELTLLDRAITNRKKTLE